ncbi:hypothetical protein RCC89_12635 [Cytophagaceae bacterium ABcell3]|nr:hypothetical protein RCC89_12635 [Cytophagaceae bacterium ABcell3]
MTKKLTFIAFTLFVLYSCGTSRYEFWDIEKFNIDDKALEEYEEVKILYTSRGPGNNKKMSYYIHLIAVSQKSGDTVNILTTADNGLKLEDKNKVFNFFTEDNIASKIMQMDPDDIEDIKSLEDIESQPSKTISKVARDPEFDEVADNSYPTIKGSIGTYVPNQE